MGNKEKNLVNISKRKQDILFKAIEDYISDGIPVSSSNLCEKHDLNLSSATIRNELNTLEEMGYLRKLHTSGGRVPTTLGYKVFVGTMMNALPKDTKMLKEIRRNFVNHTGYLSNTIKNVAKVISDITNYPTVVLMSGLKNFTIQKIQVLPLISNQAFVLIETNVGILDPIIINQNQIDSKVCLEVSHFLTNSFCGKKISDLVSYIDDATNKITHGLKKYEEIFKAVVDMLLQYIKNQEKAYSTGTTNLLDLPEYHDVNRAKQVIDFIENEEEIKQILESEVDNEQVEFKLGVNAGDGCSDCAVVKTNCKIDGINLGQIAVIGPERMDYQKIASILTYVNKELENKGKGDANE